MAQQRVPAAQETWIDDGVYDSQFLKWRGYVDRIPVLRAIINANADAVTASWRTEGRNQGDLADLLDQFDGNGKESFKLLMNNAIKICKVGGDAYSEIILGEMDGFDGEVPVNLETLPPSNIRQVIKRGRIKRYEEIRGTATWKPEEIFHLAYNPIGAQTHGNGVIETMHNVLIDLLNIMDTGSKIFEHFAKPMTVVKVRAESQDELDRIASDWKSTMEAIKAVYVVPDDIVTSIERHGVPQGSILDPGLWHRVLLDHVIMGSRVPELALGTGSVNSEESARMQFMGFRQMVRWDQKFLEENLRRQVFTQIFPDETPDIKFSFASEAQEERLARIREDLTALAGAAIPDNIKTLGSIKLLIELGVIENV